MTAEEPRREKGVVMEGVSVPLMPLPAGVWAMVWAGPLQRADGRGEAGLWHCPGQKRR